MGLENEPAFQKWLEDRRQRDREAGVDARGETHCTSCRGDLDDSADEGDTCLVCLAVQYGREQVEADIGLALVMLSRLIAKGESTEIGAAITELATHAAEIVALPLERHGIVGRRH